MSLVQQFKTHVRNKNLFSVKDNLLLAVSGGVDSVVLCELCNQAGFNFKIAHCNFQLRGEESERDENFVKQLGQKYAVEVLVKKFETENYSKENKVATQEAARILRYAWFDELIKIEWSKFHEKNKDKAILPSPFSILVLTAHHADDNAETVLMNFCRGTGLHGLTGIPLTNGDITRPLLPFTKNEIVVFAKENKLEFVEDSSNLSNDYTRNLFRHEIIPRIAEVYPKVSENLNDNINRFKEIERLYKFSVGEIRKKICRKKGAEIHIPVKQLMQFNNRALIYDIISDYGFSEKQVDEVIKLAESDSGKYLDSPLLSYRIIKHRHWFIISPVNSTASANIVIEKSDKSILYENGSITINWLDKAPATFKNERGDFDSGTIAFPLLLRKWKTGDYFYPMGMKKKKKVSRFLIDQKLSKSQKEKIWVIESNKKIIWIVGMRVDDRNKVTDKTKSVFQIDLETADV